MPLPPEILLLIFRNAVPPGWLLEGTESLASGSSSIFAYDLRMKLSILAVCRRWNQLGMELLYHCGLGGLASCRYFYALYKVANGSGEVKQVFDLCPRLAQFGFIPTFIVPGRPSLLPTISSTVTHLEYSRTVEFADVVPSLVQLSRDLIFLALTLPVAASNNGSELSFDNLEDLRLLLNFEGFTLAASKWAMPKLKRTWLRYLDRIPELETLDLSKFQPFFDAFGRTLTFLSWNLPATDLQHILDLCPILDHLVVSDWRLHGQRLDVKRLWRHKAITVIDVWVSWPVPRLTRVQYLQETYPALRAHRCLDHTFIHLWDLPARIYPDTAVDASSRNPYRIRQFIEKEFIRKPSVEYIPVEQEDHGGSLTLDSCESDSVESCIIVGEDGVYLSDEFYVEEN
ncbi:hypothetical protein C8J57DRAFT_1567536 [Mycena rebaudengoi]|nr:hypothetical protein C8J57DRAFT_1567536 [Mycena rebaudengoi]